MRYKFIFGIVLGLLLVSQAFAEISLKSEIDKTSITTDQAVIYKLSIIATEKAIPQPQMPKFEDFYVLSQSQSSSISFAKSGLKTSITYVFILVPKEEGTFKIEPAKIKSQGKTYASDSFEIKVSRGTTRHIEHPMPRRKPEIPQPKNQPESKEPQLTL